jgi:hypothetical protein
MSSTESLQRLREAIELEQHEQKQLKRSYLELTQRMALYQSGEGPAPTVKEFLAWRESAAQQWSFRMRAISDLSATTMGDSRQSREQGLPSEH